MERLRERIEAQVGTSQPTSSEGDLLNRYDAYDPFARVYNQHWGFFATKAYPILEHLVLGNLPPGCAVLDLCCGTGQLAAELSRQGYLTAGLDGSEGMIEIARKNAPDVEFVVEDARDFALPGRFAAVFSTFDSLNHVMSLDELEQVFRSVFAALERVAATSCSTSTWKKGSGPDGVVRSNMSRRITSAWFDLRMMRARRSDGWMSLCSS